MPGEDNKTCQTFNCPYYYNYSQDGCIDNIPDGYYMNDTELRTIDKCHENCKTCKGKETNISGNDISSNSSTDNKSMFKAPLMERLKKKNVKIDGMSSFKLTNFGKKAKRSGLVDLSDFDFDFNDKDKII